MELRASRARSTGRLFPVLLFATSLLVAAHPSVGAEPPQPSTRDLRERFSTWLSEVDALISTREKAAFLALAKDYQRDAFIKRFWDSRDPYPQTPRNELRDRFEDRLEEARSRFGSLTDDRARILLVHGEPQAAFQVRCTTTRSPAEVWAYGSSEQVDFGFLVVFVRRQGTGEARILHLSSLPGFEAALAQARRCINGERLLQVIQFIQSSRADYEVKLSRVLAKPRARDEEWLDTFAAYSTEVPEGAERMPGELAVSYPGRHDSRTVVQGMISVPRNAAEAGTFAGHRSYDFVLNGDVARDGELFESFRYRFGFPAPGFDGSSVPLAFHRYLRPGRYTLAVRVEDLNSGRFYWQERPIDVPAVDRTVPEAPEQDPETARLFDEATAAISSGETTLHIVPPRGDLQTGFLRIDTLATGTDIDRVRFLLDGEPLMTKTRPPYNVEIDLGEFPRRHTVRVEALDAGGHEVASDEADLNAGGNRFAVRLVEPRRGGRYERSLEARAEVQVPAGRSLDRLELYLDDTRVATLYQPPYSQPIALPADRKISYVRAVAYLPDGNSTEDVVFINAPKYLEEMDIQLVELYSSVLGADGRPVGDLDRSDFRVFEDGVEQKISRFERVEDLPIHAGVLIDNSGSMRDSLREVRSAALTFLERTITPKDRAAIITFNRFPTLAVKLTSNLSELGGGLAGLTAEGETSLYDSLIFALYYFTGIRGQRAILLLSDGKDESSKFTFEETLEYARRAGVTLFAIGLGYDAGDGRSRLSRLANETGGRAFFVHHVEELPDIYRSIEEELRSQYLVAYQSSNATGDEKFRSVELKVDRPRLKVKTISGYYP